MKMSFFFGSAQDASILGMRNEVPLFLQTSRSDLTTYSQQPEKSCVLSLSLSLSLVRGGSGGVGALALSSIRPFVASSDDAFSLKPPPSSHHIPKTLKGRRGEKPNIEK